ncbi:MAG: SDR family oxidoreductase [Spirochaetaceae bacterium]|nr:MAG: SDR family oxidoreductase [Spirochaetaceae bacterium]
MSLIDLTGQTALITGAAKRVGRSIASALADQGVNIVVHYNTSRGEAEALTAQLRDRGVDARTVQSPLDDRAQVEGMWEQALGCAPGGRISLLVNNASIFPSDTLSTLSPENLEQNLSVNALAPLYLIRLFAAQVRNANAPPACVVNLLDSRIGGYMKKHVSYALSKRMLFSLTRMLALELAPKVRVNAVAPGMVLAPEGESGETLERLAARAPLARWGAPEDVANAVAFLMRNDYLTGQVIYVDGGAFIKEDPYG